MHANWVQTSLENATRDPFGTKSRPGRLQDAPTGKNYYSKIDELWSENVTPRADYGSDMVPQMAPKTRF